MNNVALMGRLTTDPEVKYSTGENATAVARFSIAVNRDYKNAEGTYDADFIRCVAFKSQAEFLQKWFHKGDMIAVQGQLVTGNYTNKDGVKVYTTDVRVDKMHFCGSKSNNESQQAAPAPNAKDFINQGVNLGSDEEPMPF